MLEDITPLLLTYNEEPNLGRVLERLTWAKRIVIVDSGSTDRTVEIATSFPQVSVVSRAFVNHESQWNFGLDQIRTPWVLTLDADYVLSEELVRELREKAPQLERSGYYARFRYCIGGRPLRGTLYPPRIVLFRVDRGRYVNDGHTQLLRLEGEAGWLASLIDHDDRKSLSDWLRAQDRYASLEAEKLSRTAPAELGAVDRIRGWKWLAPFITPVYCLLAKGLIFDGMAGLHYTFQRTYAELLLSLRLIERDLRARHGMECAESGHAGPI